jgi:putative chitinase
MRMPEPKERSNAPAYISGDATAPAARVQTKSTGGNGGIVAPPVVQDVLRSPGQPLDAATRAYMEPRFGQDFSHVRVHADTPSANASRAVGAKAFVHGKDVVFGSGQYRPSAPMGLELIAHELAHVIQQRGGSTAIKRKIDTGYVDHGASPHAMGTFDPVTGVYTVPEDKSIYPDQSNPYDTLFSIAKRFGTTADDIMQLNGPEGSKLSSGQKIRLPKTNSKTETKAAPIHKESGQKSLPGEHAKEAGPDFISIAQNVWDAMFGGLTGIGTTETVVYANLAKLNHDKTLIDGFKKVYRALHGSDVVADIKSEFSNSWWAGDELTRALGYLNESAGPALKTGAKAAERSKASDTATAGTATKAHFTMEELTHSQTASRLGIENTPGPNEQGHVQELVGQMEAVRALFNCPITITVAYRNPEVNRAVGGSKTSSHLSGYAADFHVAGLDDLAAAMIIRDSELQFDQLIYEKGRCIHIGFDPRLRREVKRQPGPAGSQLFDGLEP